MTNNDSASSFYELDARRHGFGRIDLGPWRNSLGNDDEFKVYLPTCLRRGDDHMTVRLYGPARATRREAFDWLRAHAPAFDADNLGVLHAGRVMADGLGQRDWAQRLVDAERNDDRSALRKRWDTWWDDALKYGGVSGRASLLQGLVNLGFWFIVAPVMLVVLGLPKLLWTRVFRRRRSEPWKP